jgi:signal transduction histidine kinase
MVTEKNFKNWIVLLPFLGVLVTSISLTFLFMNKNAIHNAVNYFEHTPYRIITKEGTVKWIREYKLLVKNEKGKIAHVIGYITDITHIKKQEQLEIESKKTMALKELINNLAHQWRQPLSVISTAASGMKLQDELEVLNSQLIQEYCQNIIETYQRSLDITNRYLKYEDKELYGLEVCIKLPIEKR